MAASRATSPFIATMVLLSTTLVMQGLAFLPAISSTTIFHRKPPLLLMRPPHGISVFATGLHNHTTTSIPVVPSFPMVGVEQKTQPSPPSPEGPASSTSYHTSGVSFPPDELPHTPPTSPRGHADDADTLTLPPKPTGVNRESGKHLLYWFFTWPVKELLPGVRVPVILNILWSWLVVQCYQEKMFLPLDATPHNFLAGALGFLLTFRASEGYSRCVEGRGVWDGVLNVTRDIVRTVVACGDLLGPARTKRLVDLTCAYAITLAEFVQEDEDYTHLLKGLLRPSELAGMRSRAHNVPLLVTELLTQAVEDAAKANKDFQGSPHFPRVLSFVDQLGHYVTQCQRLSKPPGRYSYKEVE